MAEATKKITSSPASQVAPTKGAASQTASALKFERFFSKPGVSPYDEVQWELRTASIGNDKGAIIFEQRDVEVPVEWSQTATNIVVSKYFYGKIGSPERESSVRQLIGRVAPK